jgi:hypothetical protein
MNDAIFILTPARYLVQIASEGEWKTVAYLNDIEEAWRTIVTDQGLFLYTSPPPVVKTGVVVQLPGK